MQSLPFALSGQFYRGNLHTHSTNSDGDLGPAEVIARYKGAGYDFISLTDHFLPEYDWPVSDTRALRDEDFTTLIGAELHAPKIQVGEAWHFKAIGLPLDFAPPARGEGAPALAKRAYDAGAFIGICHPSWNGLTVEDARTIDFAHGIEIYNHGSEVENGRGRDWAFCDALLNEGWRLSGYATDDAHHLTHDWLGGWVMVKAESREPEALLAALKAGHYYSSQGPVITDIRLDDDQIHIACEPAARIIINGRGSRAKTIAGEGITEASFPLARFKEAYCRVTVVDTQDKMAWSNPIWLN